MSNDAICKAVANECLMIKYNRGLVTMMDAVPESSSVFEAASKCQQIPGLCECLQQ